MARYDNASLQRELPGLCLKLSASDSYDTMSRGPENIQHGKLYLALRIRLEALTLLPIPFDTRILLLTSDCLSCHCKF